jgi:hypothetical protein
MGTKWEMALAFAVRKRPGRETVLSKTVSDSLFKELQSLPGEIFQEFVHHPRLAANEKRNTAQENTRNCEKMQGIMTGTGLGKIRKTRLR